MSIKIIERNLLEKLAPELILWNFAGRPKLIEHGWLVRLLRCLLRKGPDYKHDIPQFPKGREKIKFKRYKQR